MNIIMYLKLNIGKYKYPYSILALLFLFTKKYRFSKNDNKEKFFEL